MRPFELLRQHCRYVGRIVMMNWEQQRDLHLAKREQAMADARAVMMQSAVKFDRTLGE